MNYYVLVFSACEHLNNTPRNISSILPSRWVLYGELQDPHKEFFVVLNPAITVRNIWRETYVLQHTMLPAYFSHNLAQKILLIGKSINFIRLCLQKMPRVTAKDEEIDAKRNG